MRLERMSPAEYEVWSDRSRALYARDKARANDISQEAAEKIAKADFERLLSNGLASEHSHLFVAKADDQKIVGYLWLLERGPESDRRGYVGDVIIEEEQRGKGYGRKIMELAEFEVRKLGHKKIGLHVFGYNTPAIRLYESLGYVTTDLVMEKNLTV